MTRDESPGPSAHVAEDGFDNENRNGKTSLEVKLELVEEAAWLASGSGSNANVSREEVIDLISSLMTLIRRNTVDANSMQVDNDASIPAAANHQRHSHSHSPSPHTHTHRNSNPPSPSGTNTDSYVAPLSPLSPPPQNLDDIPPWPASPSRSSVSLRRGSPMSAVEESGSDERCKSVSPSVAPVHLHSMPSPMSALSSVRSSPAFNHKMALDGDAGLQDAVDAAGDVTVKMMKAAVSSFPLSSPLSSPVENLISFPAHSAPPAPSTASVSATTSIDNAPEDVAEMQVDEPNIVIVQSHPRPATPSPNP
ncbi:hypothetical protein BT96DRAFT_507071 [Gymnopus androsaceus JB14]|uniref:Uncharacterized protein n=1 Tax=Gymnopus androsaceus JB14 TaxID=1447944 RepID=A0A6A4GNS0_9AGAR|nr:hypothetical protein BT96DRAFT_507071 [Gymnopus androsaceus JB14]